MTNDHLAALLAGWLSELPATLAGNLILRGKEVELAAGQTVFKVGDETRSIWCILSGAVRMNIATNENEHRFGHLITPGFWFGEYELLTGHPRLLEMQCAVPTRLMRFAQSDIEEIAKADPSLWRWIAVLSAQHTLLALSAADDLLLKDPVRRCAALLLRLAGHRAAHPATYRSMSCRSARTTSPKRSTCRAPRPGRSCGRVEREGAVKLEYGSIRLLDVARLQAVVARF
ncbi:MAG: Crp/Fnr family transcriptional regulator [Rhodobacteraceae bacterium]|nr:Crp/Fnr family transcriptional regulator [Paracoccaceae bacterium]